MKTITPCRFAAIFALGLICASSARGQSITVEMIDHLKQTGSGTTVANGSLPYSFEVHIDSNSGTPNMANWGPGFSYPNPGTGISSNTNTATSTFQQSITTLPNKNSSYFFQANFATAGAMNTAYPASGAYSVSFTGGGTLPAGGSYGSGLNFTTNTFPVTPMVTGLTNGAAWVAVANQLNVSTSGTTTLTINSGSGDFSGYSAGTYAASVGFGLQDQSGNLIGTTGGSKNSLFGGSDNIAASTIAITGSSLTAGQAYTLTIQYGIAAGATGSGSIGADTTLFKGVAIYYAQTQISILAVPEPADAAALLGVGALGLFALRRRIRKRAGESA